MTRPHVLVLGIDAGGSSTRWLLRGSDGPEVTASEEIARGRLEPLSGLSFLAGEHSAEARQAAAVLAALRDDVRSHLRGESYGTDRALDAIYAGVTGLSDGDEAATTVRRELAQALGTSLARVRVANDMAVAYRAAFAPGEGVLLYAGTGSIAVHVTSEGRLERAGGHGYLVDDAGGGFWIGQQALRSVLREADRRGGPAEGPLAEAVYAALGSRDWTELRRRIYSGGRREVAALAPAVRHALAAGDPHAAAIVTAAGRELARLADVLLQRTGRALPVALAGGAAGLGAPLQRAVQRELGPATTVHAAERTPVEAAAHLAFALASESTAAPPTSSPQAPPDL